MISSISSNNYYMSQMSSTWSRMATSGASGQAQQMGRGPKPSEMFDKVDLDSSGSLDLEEFQTLADKISEATGEDVDADELFAAYDADEDGVLSAEEAEALLEANRPERPPPPPPNEMATESQTDSSALSAGITSYLNTMVLGMGQDQASDMLSMFNANINAYNFEGQVMDIRI